MSNHLHLVVSAKNENLSDLLRNFKKFTGKQIIPAVAVVQVLKHAVVMPLADKLCLVCWHSVWAKRPTA